MALIVETYRERKTLEKYSYDAPIAEIAENDWNLNIPRYVDTFEEEAPIDLAAVSAELKEVEKELAGTDNEIAAFCQELGIAPPF